MAEKYDLITNALVWSGSDGQYYAKSGMTGKTLYNGTSFGTAWSRATGSLNPARVSPETITTIGIMSVDIPAYTPTNLNLEIYGNWIAKTGLNNSMIKNANPTTNNYNVSVMGHNAILQGNASGQTSNGYGIEFKNDTTPPDFYANNYINRFNYRVKDLLVQNTRNTCVFVDHSGPTDNGTSTTTSLEDVSTWNPNTSVPSLYMKQSPDSRIIGGTFDGNTGGATYAIEFESMAFGEFKINYTNGPIHLLTVRGCTFSVNTADIGTDEHGWILEGVWDSVFSNSYFVIHGNGAANTYDAIRLSTAWSTYPSTDNVFSGIWIGRAWDAAGTRTYRYGINETDSDQDYNTYSGINGRDCATSAINISGANSKTGSSIQW